jgi:hypothetical protein
MNTRELPCQSKPQDYIVRLWDKRYSLQFLFLYLSIRHLQNCVCEFNRKRKHLKALQQRWLGSRHVSQQTGSDAEVHLVGAATSIASSAFCRRDVTQFIHERAHRIMLLFRECLSTWLVRFHLEFFPIKLKRKRLSGFDRVLSIMWAVHKQSGCVCLANYYYYYY